MHVFVTGGTGHSGPYIISELIAAGHEVTALARSDKSRRRCPRSAPRCVAGISMISMGSRRRLQPPTASSTSRTGKTCFRSAGSTLWPPRRSRSCSRTARHWLEPESRWSRREASVRPRVAKTWAARPTATEEDPALSPAAISTRAPCGFGTSWRLTVIGLAERGVRSSVVRISEIMHSSTDKAGFLPLLIGLAKEKGVVGYPGDGSNRWAAVHARDLATLFRLALEKSPAGRSWHAVADEGDPVPRDRRGHWQPSEPARRAHSRGRTDAAGILRVPREPGHAGYPGVERHHAPDARLDTNCSPACSPIWTTATTSLPAE